MTYITVKQSPAYHQMSLEELLSSSFDGDVLITQNIANTRTFQVEGISEKFASKINVNGLTAKLERFCLSHANLFEKERGGLYSTFYIPKCSGGLRKIDAPNNDLSAALRELKRMFENDFAALYHTSAFAYVKNRCTVDAVKRHQCNNSRWFAKLDLHDFFGSTTKDFVMAMMSVIFPFSEVLKTERGERALSMALDLTFLNGGLPQGTPISPMLTNIMMIPIDFALSNTLRDFEKQKFVYTRYADDFIISSKYDFEVNKVEKLVVDTLRRFHAPFSINEKKTRYGSSAGRNWNLGVMLNKDNTITVGSKNKKQFKSMLYNYARDKGNNIQWSLSDVQTLNGLYSYYRMVEKETIDAIVQYMSRKVGVDILALIKEDLRS